MANKGFLEYGQLEYVLQLQINIWICWKWEMFTLLQCPWSKFSVLQGILQLIFLGAFKTSHKDLINLHLKTILKVIFLKPSLLISKLSFHDEDVSDWRSIESFSQPATAVLFFLNSNNACIFTCFLLLRRALGAFIELVWEQPNFFFFFGMHNKTEVI